MENFLQIRNLTIRYCSSPQPADAAVDDVSFDIAAGETLGLMGESGCGKSSIALALLGLLPKDRAKIAGSVQFEGRDLLSLDERAFQKIRGVTISMINQEPGISLSPVMRVGDQVAEVIHAHRSWGWKSCRIEAQAMLERAGLGGSARILSSYPHQLSGGQCQRVVLAQALSCAPSLLIADEPTAHLDARSQAGFFDLLENLKEQTGMSILLISHAPEIQARLAGRLLVMKAGRIIERGRFAQLYQNPSQEYTRTMLHSSQSSRTFFESESEIPEEEHVAR